MKRHTLSTSKVAAGHYQIHHGGDRYDICRESLLGSHVWQVYRNGWHWPVVDGAPQFFLWLVSAREAISEAVWDKQEAINQRSGNEFH